MPIFTSPFPWDLAIALMLAASACVMMLAVLRTQRGTVLTGMGRTGVFLAGGAAAIVFAVVLYGSFVEPRLLVVREEKVRFPSPQSLTIALVSDFHTGPYKDAAFVKRVVDRVNSLKPDLVILAGDYLYGADSPLEALAPLGSLHPGIATIAILGNYDTFRRDGIDRGRELEAFFAEMGIMVLRDASVTIPTAVTPVSVTGLRDVQTETPDLAAASEGIPAGLPRILLSHNPDVILDERSRAFHLILSGHTHGGQIRLPFLGPVPPIPNKLGRAYDQGIFQIGDATVLAITHGVGESGVRARLFAPPEIMLLHTQVP